MKMRATALTIAIAIGIPFIAAAQQMTARDIEELLTTKGYTQVHDINFDDEANTAVGTKDGKEWMLVIDSHGKVLQKQ
jgi:hypothetical protein